MKPGTILYAEDDRAFAELYATKLKAYGYEVLLAHDGQEALRLYQEHLPDMVILDIRMDKKDGYQVAMEIRITDSVTPVLFLTNSMDESSAIKGYRFGANDYIRKGISIDEFAEKINRYFIRHPVINTPNRLNITSTTCIDFTNNTIITSGHAEKIYVNDCKLLRLLVHNKNGQLHRDFVEKNIWGENANGKDYLSKAITKLRKILEKDEKIKLHTKRNDSITLVVNDS